MKSSEIYRRAAESLANDTASTQWSCWAIREIESVSIYHEPKRETRYDLMFRPPNSPINAWGLLWGKDDKKACRILALCFMAAISESEGD